MSSEMETKSETNGNVKRAVVTENPGILEGGGFGSGQSAIENEQTDEERLSEQVFSIPLTLKGILKNLVRKDLLRTSLVDKNWNFLSREVLREEGKCLAIVRGTNFCHNLKDLYGLLSNSEAVPFNGIFIDAPVRNVLNHQCIVDADVSELMSIILVKINMKYLALKDYGITCCIVSECIREIIAEKASSLEGLSVSISHIKSTLCVLSEFLGLDLQGQWLPNVRTLELHYEVSQNISSRIIKELVEASPKLQILQTEVQTEWLEFIVPLKVARSVTDFDFKPKINSLGNVAAFSLECPQLEKFRFSTRGNDDGTSFSYWSKFHQNETSRILKQLLESSQDSLKLFSCDQFDLILMTFRWNIPVLKNVTQLILAYDYYVDIEEGFTVVKVDWAEYFPNLKAVEMVDTSMRSLDRDVYVGHAFWESNAQFLCESVKILRLESWTEKQIQMFTNVFTNLKELYLTHIMDWDFPALLNDLRTAWADLELIHVEVHLSEFLFPNFDSVFLGISLAEADYLLENVEDLESLELVSSEPTIFNLRKLKKLEIKVGHGYFCRDIRSYPNGVFLSRLASQCVFARIPGVEVDITWTPCQYHCHFTLDHLKPFAKFMQLESDDLKTEEPQFNVIHFM